MSGTYPIAPVPAKITPRSTHQSYVSVSRNLKTQASSRGGQLWGFDMEYSPLERDDFQPLWAFLVSQRGRYGKFSFSPAVFGSGRGDIGNSVPQVQGGGQIGRSVTTDGWEVGATMYAGDYFRFSGHTKVYMLTENITADGGGVATLSFEPALYQSIADNEPLVVENVDFTCSLTDDSHDFSVSTPILGVMKVSVIEVVDG